MVDNKEVTCPICGKVFYPATCYMWGWKIGSETAPKLVCSYTCQRKWERKPKKKPKRRRTPVRIVETGETFATISDCAAFFETSNNCISKALNLGVTIRDMHIERVVANA